MYRTPRLPKMTPQGPKAASRLDGVLDRARRLDEKPILDPNRPKEVSQGHETIANSNQIVFQDHRVRARALPGGQSLVNSIEIVVDFLAPLVFDCYLQHFGARERSRLHAVSLKHDLTAICKSFVTLRNLFDPVCVQNGSLV